MAADVRRSGCTGAGGRMEESVENVILRDYIAAGNSIYSTEKTLYHYTSVEVFRKILENREFWISNANFMNDEQEIMNGIELCRKVILRKKSEMRHPSAGRVAGRAEYDAGQEAYLDALLESCDRRESAGLFNIRSENIFAMSFCSSGDILTQWQEYANGGIAIGFRNAPRGSSDRIMLKSTGGVLSDMDTIRVIYSVEDKEKALSDIIGIGMHRIAAHPNENVREVLQESVSDALYQFFPAMKSRYFNHERESRFIYYVEEENQAEVAFREKQGIILPYVRMQIVNAEGQPHQELPIDDIVISPGPRIEYVEKSVKYFLRMAGYGYLTDKVRRSDIPYRV